MLFDLNSKDGILGNTGLGGIIRGLSSEKRNRQSVDRNYIAQLAENIKNSGDIIPDNIRKTKDLDGTKAQWGISDETLESVIQIGERYKTAGEQVEALQNKMKGLSSVGTKLTGVFKSIGSALLNGIASAGISLAVSALFEKIILPGMHKLRVAVFGYTKKELEEIKNKIRETAQVAKSAMSEIANSFSSTSEKVESLKDRYAELAQGVKDLGLASQSQGQLSNDEYSEFLDISNQLAEIFPDLTNGYTDNGDALLTLNGDVQTITSSLEAMLKVEKELARQKIEEEIPKVWEGYGVDVAEYSEKFNNNYKALQITQRAYEQYLDEFNKNPNLTWNEFQADHYDAANILNKAFKANGISDDEVLSNRKTLSDYDDIVRDYFDGVIESYEKNAEKLEKKIEQSNKDIQSSILTLLQFDSDYTDLSDDSKNVVNAIISNLGYDTDYAKLRDKGDWSKVYDDIKERSIDFINDLADEDSSKLTDAYKNLYGFGNSDKLITEYENNLNKVKEVLSKNGADEGVKNAILNSLPSEEEFNNKLDHFKSLFGKNWSDSLLNEFTAKDLDIAATLSFDEDAQSVEDIKKRISEAINPVTVELEPKASDVANTTANFQTAAKSLDELYSQTVLKEEKEGQATGYADPSLINSVESSFDGFVDESGELNNALEQFEKNLIEIPNDADVAQQSMNHLLTAYIDQTEEINNLCEANKDWVAAQIEATGVSNAAQVVYSRLDAKAKKTSADLKTLSKVVKENRDALEKAKKSGDKSAEVYDTIATSVKDLLTVYDDEGNAQLIPDIDAQFVIDNLEDIENAIAGDMDAIARLRVEASKGAMLNVGVYDDAFWSDANAIAAAVSQLNDSDFTIDGYMNNSDIIAKLNAVRANFQGTAQEFAAWISQITGGSLTAEIDYDVIPVSNLADKSGSEVGKMIGLKYNALTEFSKNWDAGNVSGGIRIPKVVNYKWNGSSLGSNTNYGGGGGGSSSGGGGGGGGGGSEPTQPKEETEETFDWIAVAIQRIEEEIARLDKVVNNSYDLWGNRNKALVDELEKTTEEIKAQQLAQSEYLRNANLVQVNNGKGLNEDDYGENDSLVKENDQRLLDEARAAWATGEYQRKVREGQMSGDDIEKIQNHFLAETIQTYQELYNKSVQAGDAVQDLQIKLGDLAKTRFDNVKTEIDELIAYVTSAADIIDDKIDRTEKHGYFVSKSYYQDLKKLESNQYDYLMQEYEGLIQKRDEAVAAGYITESSSAWHQMNQEINGVALALEQSKTKMVEYNNTIRQLDWDFFDWVEERISRINDEASFLVDLMSNDKLYEDNGFLNNLGHATNAMYAAQYEVYMRQAKDYADERLKLEKEIAKDPANKDLIARYEELVDAQQDAIKGAEQMKDSVKSLVQEGINLYLQSLQKLIDKYKESLSDAKDLYSYQQNIAEQTKNIGNLRKQLTAYEGDDSEETRATVQRLRTQLEDAETKLKETEWDRYISETESFLSDMYADMEETLNARLDDIDLLMHDMIDVANENSATVQDTIRAETDKVGYTLTSYLDGVLNGGQTQFSVDLNNGFAQVNGLMTNVLAVIEQIKSYAAAMVDNGKTNVESTKTTTVNTNTPTAPKATGNTNTTTSNNNKPATNTTNNNKPTRSETDKYGVALAIINGNYGWGNGDTRVKNLKAKGFNPTEIQNLVNKLWNEGYVFSGAWVGRYHGITDLSKFAFNKYAKGSKNISKDQLAWTQEKGQELIFRSSDGAMLTPLNAGDKVFTAQMTDNLWELAKGKFTTSVPKTGNGNTINNSNAISITLPNVKNYEEFKTALQNDPKMTSFIQQITLGEVSNGVKLNKKKY